MYEKELELRMSRSYGPGRYDREYEERGRDLPAGYVRWTEQRNMQAFLDLVATGRVNPRELTTHRFPIDEAAERLRALTGQPRAAAVRSAARVPGAVTDAAPAPLRPRTRSRGRLPGIGLIGAGAFARATLIPALKSAGATLVAVASESGLTAADVAARFGFERAAVSLDEILADEAIGAVVIATRHASHASLAAAALQRGQGRFRREAARPDLGAARGGRKLRSTPDSVLMVGFNRRFAPLVERMQAEFGQVDDLVLSMRVNAGPLPDDHWLHDPEDGGGRLLGEGCHFVDLLSYLAASPAISAHAFAVPQPGRPIECSDSFTAHIRFGNAVGTLVYSGGGDSKLPKERLEAFGGGAAAVLDDFRILTIHRGGKRRQWKSSRDKGHRAEIRRFLAAAAGEVEPPPARSYLDSTRLTLALASSLRSGKPVDTSGEAHQAQTG